LKSQPWKPVLAQIRGAPDKEAGQNKKMELEAPGLDLSGARIV